MRHNARTMDAPENPTDPVRVQRARWQSVAGRGQRVGYGLILVAVGAFAFGLAADFTDSVTWVVGVSLALATLTLAPAMVIGYAVKAAEREDRAQGR